MAVKKPKKERVGEIIQAAVDEFLEKGYEGTSMESIAQRAGVSKGGLYHHFSGKDEILLLANQKLNEPVTKLMEEAAHNPSPSEALQAYIKSYIEYWLSHHREMVFYMLSYVKLLDDPSLGKMYASYAEKTISFFQELYQRGIDSGEFVPHSAYESAIAFTAAVDGIVMYLMMDKSLDVDKIVSLFQDKLVREFQVDRSAPSGNKERK
jgi:AcrR family transcriptional regulator